MPLPIELQEYSEETGVVGDVEAFIRCIECGHAAIEYRRLLELSRKMMDEYYPVGNNSAT